MQTLNMEAIAGRELADGEPGHYRAWLCADLECDGPGLGRQLPLDDLEEEFRRRRGRSAVVGYYEFRLLARDPFGLRAQLPNPPPLFE